MLASPGIHHSKQRTAHPHRAKARPIGTRSAPAPADPGVLDNTAIVARIARQDGVDPATAVAAMLVESDVANKPGDFTGHGKNRHPTSFGLFQLHQGGELGNLSPEQAYNPETNATVALREFARHPNLHGGALAAAAQAPLNRAQYAADVERRMAEARRLLNQVGQ